jgi:hypothetical protein
MVTRELLPLHHILQEITQHSLINSPCPSAFNATKMTNLSATTIYEDKPACIILTHSNSVKYAPNILPSNGFISKIRSNKDTSKSSK